MKKSKLAFVGFVLTVSSVLFLNSSLSAKENTKEEQMSRIESLAKFTKVLSVIDSYYVDDMKFQEIIKKSIEGLLENLDAHSGYLDKKSYKDMKVQTDGEFGGLGITVGMRDGALSVISPIDNTPAFRAGLKAGDIILRINENSTLKITIDEAVSQMRGKPGTDITLTIVRKGENKPFDVKITRDIISVDSVYAKYFKEKDILYLRVTNFDKHVSQKVIEFVKKYKNAKGIVLDLRNNPGGLLSQAVELTDLFISDGVIVSQKGRIEKENVEYLAKKSTTITNLPLAVLINSGSASASEIVSGSLQDHKRAILIGEKTFGKGSVQVVLPLGDEDAIRLTIARYYLASGRTIQAEGVTPDIEVALVKVPLDENEFSIKENDLKQHLEKELDKIQKDKTQNKDKKSKETKKTKEDKNKKDKIKEDKEIQKKDKEILTIKDVNNDLQLKTAIDAIKILQIAK